MSLDDPKTAPANPPGFGSEPVDHPIDVERPSIHSRHKFAAWSTTARELTRESSVTLVLSGEFDDFTYLGLNRVCAGTMIVRPTFGCRRAVVGSVAAEVVDLPWRHERSLGGIYDGIDAAELVSLAAEGRGRARKAVEAIISRQEPRELVAERWTDALAAALRADLHTGIAEWARARGMTPEGVARGFSRLHGVPPARWRLELRARAAWARIEATQDPLSVIALECGFSDQAHMTRSVWWLTARRPSEWRRLAGDKPNPR